MFNITTLHVIENATGNWGYVGRVPVEIAFVDATPEKLEAAKFGQRFGPKVRVFASREEAVQFAEDHGYTVENK